MIRAVLIDDEIDSNRILHALLENYCTEVEVVGMADGVETAVTLIGQTRPDVVFMDIEMAHGNAFDLLNQLRPVNFHVIFVTAFDNHAIRAFKYNAIDYLLKPVNVRELRAAVEKLPGKLVENNLLDRVKGMLENVLQSDPAEKKLAISLPQGLSFVTIRDIIRLEANYTTTVIYLKDKTKITASGTLKDYENILPESIFFRIHQSHIVNLNMIKFYQKGRGGYVTMDDDSVIEVAIRRREAFLQRLTKGKSQS